MPDCSAGYFVGSVGPAPRRAFEFTECIIGVASTQRTSKQSQREPFWSGGDIERVPGTGMDH